MKSIFGLPELQPTIRTYEEFRLEQQRALAEMQLAYVLPARFILGPPDYRSAKLDAKQFKPLVDTGELF